mmetsp:Transcript_4921/g.14325  ORF Transcript_4921/g.14325 Transcript_4921/m.14325 type:complete len:95 (-) Transcript_4921:3394-3678(-)
MWPDEMTKIMSESLMVLRRWAMVSVVRPLRTLSRAACTTCSEAESSADVASSSRSTAGWRTMARAMAQRCFCPPLRRSPRRPRRSSQAIAPLRA